MSNTDWNGEPVPVYFSDDQFEAMAIEERNAILEDTTDFEDRSESNEDWRLW